MEGTGALSAALRRAHLARMAADPFDVLVIGGGITGAGVALEARARGYSVALVERGDFASGTSSRSTKLIHGGIRYLPQFDLSLVAEGLHERGRLLANAPHLARPLAFLLPLYDTSRHPVGLPIAPPGGIGLTAILDLGLTLYDILAGARRIAPHRRLSREEMIKRAPGMIAKGVKSGFVYYDGETDDSRLTLAVLRSAAERGAAVANYAEVTRIAAKDSVVMGVYISDTHSPSEEVFVRASVVVNATGVWAEQTDHLLSGAASPLHIAPSKGVHLVFARERLGIGEEAIVLPETEDGRIIFITPWLSRALVGTTDTAATRIERPTATENDISYLLGHMNRYLREPVTPTDIIGVFAGYRPLLRLRKAESTGRLSRAHEVVEPAPGLITVAGGKLTSYRRMAEDVVNRIDRNRDVERPSPTRQMRLHGSERWPASQEELARRIAALGLEPSLAAHLGGAYGDDATEVVALIEGDPTLGQQLAPDLPDLRAQVVYACRAEMALTLEDALARRTHLAIEDRAHGLEAAPEVAALMAAELGWSDEERERRLAAYTAYIQAENAALDALQTATPALD